MGVYRFVCFLYFTKAPCFVVIVVNANRLSRPFTVTNDVLPLSVQSKITPSFVIFVIIRKKCNSTHQFLTLFNHQFLTLLKNHNKFLVCLRTLGE